MITISVTYGLSAMLLVLAIGLCWAYLAYSEHEPSVYTVCRILIVTLIASIIGGIFVW